MELFDSNIKKFLILRGTETPKKFLKRQETELSYISENGNPRKLLISQEVTFSARKIKKNTFKKTSYISGNRTF